MKKIYLMLAGLCLSCNLHADTMLGGEDMPEVVSSIKKKLNIPNRTSENASITDMYAEDNKYVVMEFTYDKPIITNKIPEAKRNTKKHMVDSLCLGQERVDILLGDNKKNIVKQKHIYKGKVMYEETVTFEDCKKINK